MKDIINHLGDKRRQQLGEVVRFGIVGVTATLLQYFIYWLLLRLAIHLDVEAGTHTLSTVAMTIGYVVSFIYNFIASTRFTFRVKANARRGAGFFSATWSITPCKCLRLTSSCCWASASSGLPFPCFASACPSISCWSGFS